MVGGNSVGGGGRGFEGGGEKSVGEGRGLERGEEAKCFVVGVGRGVRKGLLGGEQEAGEEITVLLLLLSNHC